MTEHTYPGPGSWTPPHPAFVGKADVASSVDPTASFYVDLSEGSCTCKHGRAYMYHDKKGWIPNNWCSHKMRAASSILETLTGAERESAQAAYNRLLGNRYIIWESVSAFHKELRRGDADMAQYWSMSVAAHRGLHGVVRYMLNTLFEESRDLDLFAHLLNLSDKGRNVGFNEVMNTIRWYAEAPKKWMLDGRLAIYTDEMKGYRRLAERHGYAVAKAKDIIPYQFHDELRTEFVEGLQQKDRVRFQTGLKGLFKSQFQRGHDALKIEIFNLLTDALNGDGPFKKKGIGFDYDPDHALRVHGLVHRRLTHFNEIGYHELNALGDALTGEHYPGGDHLTPKRRQRLLLLNPRTYAPPPGKLTPIPLYALDNHNYRGKHLMNRWGATELLPGAEQVHLDFRMCGAYLGVAWRMLAWNQHKSTDVPWGDVKWYPSFLFKHVDNMFY